MRWTTTTPETKKSECLEGEKRLPPVEGGIGGILRIGTTRINRLFEDDWWRTKINQGQGPSISSRTFVSRVLQSVLPKTAYKV